MDPDVLKSEKVYEIGKIKIRAQNSNTAFYFFNKFEEPDKEHTFTILLDLNPLSDGTFGQLIIIHKYLTGLMYVLIFN